jgi:hypothetical protein
MSLLALQTAFHAEIVADDESEAPSSPGMGIYRDAYRARLLSALETSFVRTRRWVGAEAFTAAACHTILTDPPTGWTLDDYGADLPHLLESLFAQDPEVAELAWLEWQMQKAFAAPDAPQLDPAALAAAGLSGEDWDALAFTMAAGFAGRAVVTDCAALWIALEAGEAADFVPAGTGGEFLLVWRQGLSPHFRVVDPAEYSALTKLASGATLGEITAGVEPDVLGAWLARWFADGLFSAFEVCGR